MISWETGNTPIKRKGFIRVSGNVFRPSFAIAELDALLIEGMISPRLTMFPLGFALTEYQLIKAKEVPWSLRAIQVPPLGSEG